MANTHVRSCAALALAATAFVAAACGGGATDTAADAPPATETSNPPADAAPDAGHDAAANTAADTVSPDAGHDAASAAEDEHEHADGDHMDATVEASEDMSLELAVTEDGGVWTIDVITTGFRFAPESKDGPHVLGEGHGHLYVDGVKAATLLEPSYVLDDLSLGEHTLGVDLRSNDHALYELNGEPLARSETITVSGDAAGPDVDLRVEVEFGDGSAFEDLGRIETNVGDLVEIVVRAEISDEVHVHGFDVFGMVAPGEDAIVRFEPDAPGIYEVEMEGSGRLLFDLQVNG